jgi:pimeloyl-ACP methyl ester carboxylesterase
VLSLLPSAARLRHIEVRESRRGSVTLRSYTSGESGFPLVVLHGLTREGFREARLVRFCNMLAALGLGVYAPNLQGLCMMDPDPTDVESAKALLKALANEHESQIGLIGFSFGGTYALLASSSPDVAESIRFVLAVGAYCSLESVVEHAFSMRGERELSPEAIFGLLALDWKFRQMLPLTEGEIAAFEEVMDYSCSSKKHLTPRDTAFLANLMGMQQQEDIYLLWKTRLAEISSLNIEGNPALDSLKAPVFLLHSEHDTSIPVGESIRVALELTRHGKNVLRYVDRSGGHVTFSIRKTAELVRFFYRIMLLTEKQDPHNTLQPGKG